MSEILGWIGTIGVLAGMWYIGDKKWWAFIFSLVGEASYVIYALLYHVNGKPQWPLITLSAILFAFAIVNMAKWLAAERRS